MRATCVRGLFWMNFSPFICYELLPVWTPHLFGIVMPDLKCAIDWTKRCRCVWKRVNVFPLVCDSRKLFGMAAISFIENAKYQWCFVNNRYGLLMGFGLSQRTMETHCAEPILVKHTGAHSCVLTSTVIVLQSQWQWRLNTVLDGAPAPPADTRRCKGKERRGEERKVVQACLEKPLSGLALCPPPFSWLPCTSSSA